MKKQIDDKEWRLLARHLGKELTETEKEEFDQWIAESDENRKELDNAEKIWDSGDVKDTALFNTDMGWDKMYNRLHPEKNIRTLPGRSPFIPILKIAASILLLTGLACTLIWFIHTPGFTSVIAKNKKILTPVLLPDGTKVYLNAGTELRYPNKFDGNTRTVELTGEAFFEVTRNEEQPFIIQTPKAQIKVLGTSFDVLAEEKSDSVQVVVETGTVELSSKAKDRNIKLTKGNTGVYHANNNQISKSVFSDVNAIAWKTNVIVFRDANLLYISKTLSKLFSQQIQLQGNYLNNCRINSDFKQVNLESILATISELLGLEVKKTNNGYILSGPGC